MPKDEVDGDKRGVGLPQRQLGSDRADDLMREALRGHSWQSVVIRGNQWQPVAIREHSMAITSSIGSSRNSSTSPSPHIGSMPLGISKSKIARPTPWARGVQGRRAASWPPPCTPDEGGNQTQSAAEAIRGASGQRPSASRFWTRTLTWRSEEAIRGNQRQSKAIRGNPRQSEAIGSKQRTLTLATLSANDMPAGWPPATIWSSSPAYVALLSERCATHIPQGRRSCGRSGWRTQPLTCTAYAGTPR